MSDSEMRAELAKDGVSTKVQGMDTVESLRNTNERVRGYNEKQPFTENDWDGMRKEIGNHGEVKAVDAELQKIEAAEGRPATPDDLKKIVLHNTKVPPEGEPVTDNAFCRCGHCQNITDGVKLTPELAEAEGAQVQGPGVPAVPFTSGGGSDDDSGGDGGSGGAGSTGGGGEEGASGVDSLFD